MLRRMLATTFLLLAVLTAPPTISGNAGNGAPGEYGEYQDALRKAREAMERRDTIAALSLLDAALRINPEGAEGFVLLGRVYRGLGHVDEARTALDRAVALLGETTPEGQDALAELAAALGDAQQNEEAIAALKKVIARAPARTGTHRDLGTIYLSIGRLQAAADEFRREIALHPASARNEALASAWEGLGIAAYRLGDDDTALTALPKGQDSVDARYHLGLALARRADNAKAAAAFREVLRREPDHRGALQHLAKAASALGLEGERKEALDRFQKLYQEEEAAQTLRIRVRDLRKRADDRMAAGDLAGAVTAMEQSSELSPDDVDILIDLSRLYGRTGDLQRNEQVCRRALAREPMRAEAHFRLGRVLSERGDLPGAQSSLEQATRLEPLSPTYRAALAQLYMRVRRPEDAVRELRFARRLAPSDPTTGFNLGLGLAQTGNMPEAAAELETALEQGLREPAAHQALSQIYRAMGDMERSAREQRLYEAQIRSQEPNK